MASEPIAQIKQYSLYQSNYSDFRLQNNNTGGAVTLKKRDGWGFTSEIDNRIEHGYKIYKFDNPATPGVDFQIDTKGNVKAGTSSGQSILDRLSGKK